MKSEIRERIEMIKLGEVPQGYKQSELGVIPLEWDIEKLGAVMLQVKEKAGTQILEALSITAGTGFVNQAGKFGKQIAGEQYKNYSVLRKGEFSYNKGNSKRFPQGCIYMLEDREKAAVPNVFNSFKLKDGNGSAKYYKFLFDAGFLNKQLSKQINSGVRNDGLLNLYDDDFYACQVFTPPLPEQEKIAEILSCCDEAIILKETLLEQKEQQKKYLIQNLLNPDSGVRVKCFENSEWKTVKFGDLCVFYGNLSIPRDQLTDKGICYLHYGDIHKSNRTYLEAENYQFLPKFLNLKNINLEKYMLHDGDIVFVDASEDFDGVSKYVVISNPNKISFIAGLHTIIAKSRNNDMDDTFKRYVFQAEYIKKQFAFYKSGMKVFGLSKTNIAKIQLRLPTIDEQIVIANILSIADREIELLQKGLDEQRKLKKALMQLLLTGKVRCM